MNKKIERNIGFGLLLLLFIVATILIFDVPKPLVIEQPEICGDTNICGGACPDGYSCSKVVYSVRDGQIMDIRSKCVCVDSNENIHENWSLER